MNLVGKPNKKKPNKISVLFMSWNVVTEYLRIDRNYNLCIKILTFDKAVPINTIHPHPPSGGTNFVTFCTLLGTNNFSVVILVGICASSLLLFTALTSFVVSVVLLLCVSWNKYWDKVKLFRGNSDAEMNHEKKGLFALRHNSYWEISAGCKNYVMITLKSSNVNIKVMK